MKIAKKSKKSKIRSAAVLDDKNNIKRDMLKKKRKTRIKRRLTIFVFLLVCIGLIVAVLKAPFFNVKTIYSVGQQSMTEEEILNLAKLQTGNNIFVTNIRAVKKRLTENPEIAEVNVRRVFPDKIKIMVKEAKPVAYAEHESRFLMIDLWGKIIKVISGEETAEVPAIARIEGVEIASAEPGERITAEGDARAGKMFECMEILAELEMLDKINYINFSDLSDLQLDYENRLYMLLGSYDNMDYKLKFSKKVIDENISEYEKALFDYRGDKLYVGPRETPQDKAEAVQPDAEGNENESVEKVTENENKTPENEEAIENQ